MTTRAIRSVDAAAVADLVRLLRGRAEDVIDPWPPALEAELLVDMGARPQDEPCHPRVAVQGDRVVGYGVLDFSPALRRGLLVGPVVRPEHRRQGHGRALLMDLLDRARRAKQKFLRGTVGDGNAAGRALLAAFGFREKDSHTCVRLPRPAKLPLSRVNGVELRRVGPDDAERYFAFTERLVARHERQTRALLKADNYIAVLAVREGRPVACVEVDMRYGDTATVENLEAPPSLLAQGVGNALLVEAAHHAFANEAVQALDLLVAGADEARLEPLKATGFTVRHTLTAYELRL